MMKVIEDSEGELLQECDECHELKDELVEFDEGLEYCKDCLKKALEMLDG